MGFFDALGKIVQGKPVFEPNQNQSPASGHETPATVPVAGQAPARTGPKIYPQAYIEQVECRMNGDDMDVDATIQNYGHGPVEIDKIRAFGRSWETDRHLKPGEEYEFEIFNGDRPRSNNQTSLEVYVKDEFGDYFCADHYIEYKQESDGTYSINRVRYVRTRDV